MLVACYGDECYRRFATTGRDVFVRARLPEGSHLQLIINARARFRGVPARTQKNDVVALTRLVRNVIGCKLDGSPASFADAQNEWKSRHASREQDR